MPEYYHDANEYTMLAGRILMYYHAVYVLDAMTS